MVYVKMVGGLIVFVALAALFLILVSKRIGRPDRRIFLLGRVFLGSNARRGGGQHHLIRSGGRAGCSFRVVIVDGQ